MDRCYVYTISDGLLTIKSGFLYKNTISIETIKELKSTHSMLSSPAASLDRLLIRYNTYDSVMISPEDKGALIKDLLTGNPSKKLSDELYK